MSDSLSIPRDTLFSSLPREWEDDLSSDIQEAIRESNRKVVVLDDDPTGTQTVHDVHVLTEWSTESLAQELTSPVTVFYILTNSRSTDTEKAKDLNREIALNLLAARRLTRHDFVVVSRSDSTLRGHFPGEVHSLSSSLGEDFDGCLLIPFFLEGKRYTANDVHYVDQDGILVPVAKTEFAGDAVFGYRSSNLRKWVEEKTAGEVKYEDVRSISLGEIRKGGPHQVFSRLMTLEDESMCVVNAVSQRDLQVFTLGLLKAESEGKRFLYRTAASFVQARAGIASRPLLTRSELRLPREGGGLFVVGSHVPRTTLQLEALLRSKKITGIEVVVERLTEEREAQSEINRVVQGADELLDEARDVVIYSSRKLLWDVNGQDHLDLGRQVSQSLVEVVRRIRNRPRYLLTKGGITSSDIATQGYSVRRATVIGQILPGVPVWRLDDNCRYPSMVDIIFPGNVGTQDSLLKIVEMLKRKT